MTTPQRFWKLRDAAREVVQSCSPFDRHGQCRYCGAENTALGFEHVESCPFERLRELSRQ